MSRQTKYTKLPLATEDFSTSLLPKSDLWSRVKAEIKQLLKLAFPVIIANLTIYLILTESIIMAGHLTKYELDAVSLSNSILNVFGLAVATGLGTACDTLFSQMYTSRYRKSIGMMLQKSVLVLLLFPILLIGFYVNVEPILVLTKQHPIVAKLAGKYVQLFSPGIIFVFLYIIFTRYLQSQSYVLPPMIVGLVVNVLNAISQYVAIYQLNLGYEASAICQALSFVIFVILILIYIYKSGMYEETWNGWTVDSFLDWWAFLKLAIPGAGMVLFECFSFEISTILSGILGTIPLAAQTVVFQVETITFNINFAVAVAVNIRVGNELGAGYAIRAKLAYRIGLILIMFIYLLLAGLELGLMYEIPKWFTNDKQAQLLAADTFPIIIGLQFFDAVGTVTMGALRGCGRQKMCVAIVFIAYYLVGLPIGIYMAFFGGYALKGLWIGLLISLGIVIPTVVIFTNFIQNWQRQAELCLARIEAASMMDKKDGFFGNEEIYTEEAIREHLIESMSDASDGEMITEHRKSLSESFTSSADGKLLVKMKMQSEVNYRGAIWKCALLYLCALLILIAGVMVINFLPTDLYRKENMTRLDIEVP